MTSTIDSSSTPNRNGPTPSISRGSAPSRPVFRSRRGIADQSFEVIGDVPASAPPDAVPGVSPVFKASPRPASAPQKKAAQPMGMFMEKAMQAHRDRLAASGK